MYGQYPRITHLIFDMDGLLLNTEQLHLAASNMLLAKYGKTLPLSLKARTSGRTSLESAKLVVEELRLPLRAEQYVQSLFGFQKELWRDTAFMPGAERLLGHVFRSRLPAALATSIVKPSLERKTVAPSVHALFDKFPVTVCGDDPEVRGRGKPAPDLFLVAARRLNAQPSQCLVFEDSPAGVQA
eukprot:RCo052965